MKYIAALGNVVVDCVMYVDKLPRHDEKVFAKSTNMSPGGPAIHFALMMNQLGLRSSVIGVTGNDALGQELTKNLDKSGICTDFLYEQDIRTPMAVILVDSSGEKSVIVSPTLLQQTNNLVPSMLRDISIVNFQHLHTHLFEPELVEGAIQQCCDKKVSCSIDIEPSSVIKWGADRVKKTIAFVDYVFINEPAISLLEPGYKKLEDGLISIRKLGPKHIVCTRGSKGSMTLSGDYLYTCYAIQVIPKNTTAAGDIFAASVMKLILEGSDMETALRFASAASALMISGNGDVLEYPNEISIRKFMNKIGIKSIIKR